MTDTLIALWVEIGCFNTLLLCLIYIFVGGSSRHRFLLTTFCSHLTIFIHELLPWQPTDTQPAYRELLEHSPTFCVKQKTPSKQQLLEECVGASSSSERVKDRLSSHVTHSTCTFGPFLKKNKKSLNLSTGIVYCCY